MIPAQCKSLGAFWSLVRQIERRILESSHRPCPLEIDDLWNSEFEDVYEAIHPLLVCISWSQLFNRVSSLPHLRGPFEAENAHQALMFQLNPEEAMYGDISLLETKEYVALRKLAEAEAEQLANMDVIPVAVPVVPRCGADVWDEDYVVQWMVPDQSAAPALVTDPDNGTSQTAVMPDPLSYSLSETKLKLVNAVDEVPCSAKKLAKLVGCEQQTCRRYLPELVRQGLIRKVGTGYVRPR